MNQPSLFDPVADKPGKVRRDHPTTAKLAAVAVIPRSGTARWKVLCSIGRGPKTDEQIQDELVMPSSTERPRRVELVEGGWVEAHPHRQGRTRSGSPAIVWRLTEQGGARLRASYEQSEVKVGDRL